MIQRETEAERGLKEAFTESNLPILEARIPASFHSEIGQAHVVVQGGNK